MIMMNHPLALLALFISQASVVVWLVPFLVCLTLDYQPLHVLYPCDTIEDIGVYIECACLW